MFTCLESLVNQRHSSPGLVLGLIVSHTLFLYIYFLSLMIQFQHADIIFAVKFFKSPFTHFNIMDYFVLHSYGTRLTLNFMQTFLPYEIYFPCLWNCISTKIIFPLIIPSQQLMYVILKISSSTSFNWSLTPEHMIFTLALLVQ